MGGLCCRRKAFGVNQLIWICLGSAIGGTVRYALDQLSLSLGQGMFPISTLLVNLSGSLLIGYLAGRWAGGKVDPSRWHFWITGICGGYTTFSAFSWQVLELIRDGHATQAGVYAALSVGLGVVAVWVGLSLVQPRLCKQTSKT